MCKENMQRERSAYLWREHKGQKKIKSSVEKIKKLKYFEVYAERKN